ncbi:7TM diverse intracellular signaling domain-containing protein [Jiulongibacter sediminis]|uniref:sensor histidine kinase n=1 Tax=Jiulongibacter sediminis TaxID=1605367 RepID=UPI0026EE0620|nr:7TM diverse intracellular signaling domain-containing protein [Jiulongibacter sediminis]
MRQILTILALSVLCLLKTQAQEKAFFLRDTTGQISFPEILNNGHFEEQTDGDFGLDNVWHWLKIDVQPSHDDRVILIENSFLDEIHCYFKGPDTLIDFGEMFYGTPVSERPIDHYQFGYPVPKSGGTYYLRVYRKFLKLAAPFKIYTAQEFRNEVSSKNKVYAGFTGIFACVILFSLILFGINRKWYYLFYSLYTFHIWLSTLLAEGSVVEYFHRYNLLFSSYNWRNMLNNLVVLWLFGFVNTFILAGAKKTRFLKTLIILSLIGILVPLALLPFEDLYIDHLKDLPAILKFYPYSGFTVGTFFCFALVAYSLIFKVQPFSAKIFLIGFTPLLIYSFLSPMRNIGVIPDYEWLSYKTRLACILFDVLFIFIGIALQIRRLSKEKLRQTRLALEAELQLYKEKERISRDLHDNVGSQLTVVSTGIDRALYLSEKEGLKKSNLEQLGENVRSAIQSLRDSIWATHSEKITANDLALRIKNYLLKLSDQVTINGQFSDKEIDASHALDIYRIFQEAAQNIIKHAGPAEIFLTFKENLDGLSISLKDTGNGFDPLSINGENHFGLENMKARASQLPCNFSIKSETGQGTEVILQLNLKT